MPPLPCPQASTVPRGVAPPGERHWHWHSHSHSLDWLSCEQSVPLECCCNISSLYWDPWLCARHQLVSFESGWFQNHFVACFRLACNSTRLISGSLCSSDSLVVTREET